MILVFTIGGTKSPKFFKGSEKRIRFLSKPFFVPFLLEKRKGTGKKTATLFMGIGFLLMHFSLFKRKV